MHTFTKLGPLVRFAQLRANRGEFDGTDTLANKQLRDLCTHKFLDSKRRLGVVVIYTRDTGYHSSGWFKNPDYERCMHLSLSFRDVETGERAGHDTRLADDIVRAFWPDDYRKTWIEGAYTKHGRSADVRHYRVFCDPAWQPILPRGEVYSTDLTEIGWQSYSEQHPASLPDST